MVLVFKYLYLEESANGFDKKREVSPLLKGEWLFEEKPFYNFFVEAIMSPIDSIIKNIPMRP